MSASTSSNERRAIEINVTGGARDHHRGEQRVTMVPLSIQRRQYRKLITPPAGEDSALASGGIDPPMVIALGRAFYWQKLLDEGRYATISELARDLHVEPGWAAEVLRLTTLAPGIVEAIASGRQPRHLNLHRIRGRDGPLPRDWQAQRELLLMAT